MDLTRTQALDLLKQYNKDPFHIRHALTVEAVMGWFARELGYGDEAGFWSAAGLLHDLDFEMWPDEHCIKSQELYRHGTQISEKEIQGQKVCGWLFPRGNCPGRGPVGLGAGQAAGYDASGYAGH